MTDQTEGSRRRQPGDAMSQPELHAHLRRAAAILSEHARHWAGDIRVMSGELAAVYGEWRDHRHAGELATASRLEAAADGVDHELGAGDDVFAQRREGPIERARRALFAERGEQERFAGLRRRVGSLLRTMREARERFETRLAGGSAETAEAPASEAPASDAPEAPRGGDRLLGARLEMLRQRYFANGLERSDKRVSAILEEMAESVTGATVREAAVTVVNAQLRSAAEYAGHVGRGNAHARVALSREAQHLEGAILVARTELPQRQVNQVDKKIRTALVAATQSPDAATARDAWFHLAKHYAIVQRYTLASRAMRRFESLGGGDVLQVEPGAVELLSQVIDQGRLDSRVKRQYRRVEVEATRAYVLGRGDGVPPRTKPLRAELQHLAIDLPDAGPASWSGAQAAAALYGDFARRLRADGLRTGYEQLAYQRQGTFLHEAAREEAQARGPEAAMAHARRAERALTKALLTADPDIDALARHRAVLVQLDAAGWDRPEVAGRHLRAAEHLAAELQPVQIGRGMSALRVTPQQIDEVRERIGAVREQLGAAVQAPAAGPATQTAAEPGRRRQRVVAA